MNWKVLDNDVGGNSAYIPREKRSAIAAAALGAGISALGGLLSSSAQNSANASMDRETRAWQENMWYKNNEYNTPVNQRKRLEAAGINPALAFQSGNTGAVSSAPSAVNHTPADYSALGAGFNQAAMQLMQGQQVAAQTDLLKSQAEAQKIDNQTLHVRRLAEWQKLKEDARKTGSDTKWIDWQIDKDMAMYDAFRKKEYVLIHNLETQSELNNALTSLNVGRNDREQKQLSSAIRQLEAAANASDSAAELSRRNAGIIPRLSKSQLEQVADAFVNEKLKNASAEEIAGFKFSGASVERLKSAVYKFLIGN